MNLNKNILSLVGFIIVFFQLSCSNNSGSEKFNIHETESKINLDWLIGNWERTNDEAGQKTFENWRKDSAEIYIGEGFTLAENDTIFIEDLKIMKIDDIWNFEVTGVNESPTYFKFINDTENSFTCENKLNDFPKTIMYSFDNNMLTVIISDDSNKIIFSFVKID